MARKPITMRYVKDILRLKHQNQLSVREIAGSCGLPASTVRILRDEFRNRRKGMVDEVMAIGCTLHNFRWESRQRALAA